MTDKKDSDKAPGKGAAEKIKSDLPLSEKDEVKAAEHTTAKMQKKSSGRSKK